MAEIVQTPSMGHVAGLSCHPACQPHEVTSCNRKYGPGHFLLLTTFSILIDGQAEGTGATYSQVASPGLNTPQDTFSL